MKKKFKVLVCLVLMFIAMIPYQAKAAEDPLRPMVEIPEVESFRIVSKKRVSDYYGPWRKGPEGTNGPQWISFNNGTFNWKVVIFDLTGSIDYSAKQFLSTHLKANYTIKFGNAEYREAGTRVFVDKGEHKYIRYRPRYLRYTVVTERTIKRGGVSYPGGSWTNFYLVFDGWHYDVVTVK